MSTPSEIQLPFGKSIDLEKAISIGHGVDDIISRMLSIAEHLRRLQVDQHEFVALKVLILISPGISIQSARILLSKTKFYINIYMY